MVKCSFHNRKDLLGQVKLESPCHSRTPGASWFLENQISSKMSFSLSLFLLRKPFSYSYLFNSLAVLGLHCCTWTFSSCCEQGPLSSCDVQASLCRGFSC